MSVLDPSFNLRETPRIESDPAEEARPESRTVWIEAEGMVRGSGTVAKDTPEVLFSG